MTSDPNVTSLDRLSIRGCPPEGVGRYEESEACKYQTQADEPIRTKICRLLLSGGCRRSARHTRSRALTRKISTFVGLLAASCLDYGAADASTLHVRVSHQTVAKASPHRSLIHANSRFLKRMCVPHRVMCGASFNADKDLRLYIVIERGGLREALASGFRHEKYNSQRRL